MKVKTNLKVILAIENIKQKDIAETIGISRGAISQIVRGETVPTLPVALHIANYIKKPVEEIWELVKK